MEEVTMRIAIVAGLLAAVVGCGTDRSRPGFTTSPGSSGSSRAALTLRIVDDPAGAVNVIRAASRPIVSIVFEATGQGTTAFQFTGASQIQMTVPLDSSQTTSALIVDVPADRFDRVVLRLVRAHLAIPGDRVPSRDMLAGSSPTLQRTMLLDLRTNAGTLVIDLNSAQWMRTIANPPPGEPAYAFDGAGAFLNAIAVRTQ
jgi:hypothetical protein